VQAEAGVWKVVLYMWSRDWSEFDWETFVEQMVEFRQGKREQKDVLYTSDELTEYIKWINEYDQEAVTKFNIFMYFGGNMGMNKEKIWYYMNNADKAEEYVKAASRSKRKKRG
jgi:hypothetical protein